MLCQGKVRTALTLSITLLLLGSYVIFQTPTARAAVIQITWSVDQTLPSGFTVLSNEELVIKPGVTVKLGAGQELNILGNLTAIGTSAQPIHFGPTVAGTPWGMINLTYSARGSHLSYCQIEQATTGIYTYLTDLYVDHSNISSNTLDGIHALYNPVYITNSTFHGNGVGQPLIQAGLYLNHASGLVDNNNITDNNHGIYMKDASSVTVRNNNILGSTCFQCAGIKVRSGSTPLIKHNHLRGNYDGIISNNSQSTIINNNVTFNLDDGILLVNQDFSLVQDNSVSHNSDDGLDINSGATPNLVHNDIFHNSNCGVRVNNATVNMTTSTLHESPYGIRTSSNARIFSSSNTYESNYNYGIAAWDSNLTSINDTIFQNWDIGIELVSTKAILRNPTININKWGISAADSSEVYIEDGYSKSLHGGDLEIENMAHVTTLNFTRWNQTVKYGGNDARLTVKWYLTVNVTNQSGVPLQGVNVSITPNGYAAVNGTTNSLGTLGRLVFTEFNKTYVWGSVTEHIWSPYLISASHKGVTNSTDINLTSTKTVTLKLLILNNPPVLAVPFGNYSFNEDTTAYGLVNCSEHFTDPDPMVYDLVMQSDPTKVLGKINGSKLDFFTPTKNWNGLQTFQVRANETDGLSTLSNIFNVTVLPVNDPPVLLPQADLYRC
jgi:parallel beta-helix repeat protein